MDIKNQVCSLEQAKRLKELGVKHPGYFCYAHPVKEVHKGFDGEATDYIEEYKDEPELMDLSAAMWNGLPYCHAYTVAELGVMLDDFVGHSNGDNSRKWIAKFKPSALAARLTEKDANGIDTICETEAQARAGLLIHMLETGWLDAEKSNDRLRSA